MGVDPIASQFPHVTTYNYAENSPIRYIDLWGLQKADPPLLVGANDRPKIYDTGFKEWAQMQDPNTVLDLSVRERIWGAGQYFGLALPSAKLAKSLSLVDNVTPVADDVISGFSKVETDVLNQAKNILNSKEFKAGIDGMCEGQCSEALIDGIPVVFQADAPFSGMTLFQEGGFVVGQEALKSSDEISTTVLHETFRLWTSNSKSGGVGQDLITNETSNVVDFLNRALDWLKQ